MFKKVAVFGVVGVLVLAGCGSGAGVVRVVPETEAATDEAVASETTEQRYERYHKSYELKRAAKRTIVDAVFGETVTVDNVTVTITDLKTLKEVEGFFPDEGNVFLTMLVKVENSSDKAFHASSLLMLHGFFDGEKSFKDVRFNSNLDGFLAPGETVEGSFVTQGAAEVKDFVVEFVPEWAGGYKNAASFSAKLS